MSDVNQVDNTEFTEDELTALKKQADKLGISYSPNIGLDTLRTRVREKLGDDIEVPKTKKVESENLEYAQIEAMRKECLRLIRCQITPMDVLKKEYQGEIFSVRNSVLGIVKRMIPFNVPTHVEKVLLDQLYDKECQIFTSRTNNKGQTIREAKSIKAYGIVELPPLTEKELADLAKSQQARNNIE